MTFASQGLLPPLLRALDTLGYRTPTPVQTQAIPLVLAGRDLMAAAQTGTGKARRRGSGIAARKPAHRSRPR
jgi:ATP-dependent RNA helicase RhlE